MRKYLLLTLMLLAGSICSNAATKEEMEQARALVAKWGVRSQNSASGYLDGMNPKNIDQVKASVGTHDTDNSNLGKLGLGMPSDYESWDKDQMVNYWMNQYNSKVPASAPDKSFCATRLKSQLNGLSATVVAKAPAPKPEETAPAAPSTSEGASPENNAAPAPSDNNADSKAAEGEKKDEKTKQKGDSTKTSKNDINFNEVLVAEADPDTEPLTSAELSGDGEAAEGATGFSESGSNTWIIVVLVVLILVVLALVGYASNIMARNSKRDKGNPRRHKDEEPPIDRNYPGGYSNDDIILPGSNAPAPHNPHMGGPQGGGQMPMGGGMSTGMGAAGTGAVAGMSGGAVPYNSPQRPGVGGAMKPRIIYLSNANSDGVFLRAEAQYNLGNSIFKLITTDGYSGTFSVIDDPNVHEMALLMPVDFLVNACDGLNLQLSQGARAIVTDSTGTAVFENGRWRVARKAQIHYTR